MEKFQIFTVILLYFSHVMAGDCVLPFLNEQRKEGKGCDLHLKYDGREYIAHSFVVRVNNSKIENYTTEKSPMELVLQGIKCSENIFVSHDTFSVFIDLSYRLNEEVENLLENLEVRRLYELYELLKFMENKNILPIIDVILPDKLAHFVDNSKDLIDSELEALVCFIKATNNAKLMHELSEIRLKKLSLADIKVRDINEEVSASFEFEFSTCITKDLKPKLIGFNFDREKIDDILNHFSNQNFKNLSLANKKGLLGICTKAMEEDDFNLLGRILDTEFIDIDQLFIANKNPALDENKGSALLAYATQLGAKKCFKLLIEKGADINTKTNSKGTVCHGRSIIKWAKDDDMKKFISEQIGDNLIEDSSSSSSSSEEDSSSSSSSSEEDSSSSSSNSDEDSSSSSSNSDEDSSSSSSSSDEDSSSS